MTVASRPAFALRGLAFGVGLIAFALAALIALRRRPPQRRTLQIAIRWACAMALIAGAISITGSVTAI